MSKLCTECEKPVDAKVEFEDDIHNDCANELANDQIDYGGDF